MTEEELKQAYFENIKVYLNNFLDIRDLEDAPLPIKLAVELLIKASGRDKGIQSEKIADLNITYFANTNDYPPDVMSLIEAYRNVRW